MMPLAALAALGLIRFQGQLRIEDKQWQAKAGADLALRRAIQVVF